MQMMAVSNNVFRLIFGKRFDFFLKLGHDIEVLRVVFTKHSKVIIKKWRGIVTIQQKTHRPFAKNAAGIGWCSKEKR